MIVKVLCGYVHYFEPVCLSKIVLEQKVERLRVVGRYLRNLQTQAYWMEPLIQKAHPWLIDTLPMHNVRMLLSIII